jgi:hypothetical protein
MPQGAAPSCNGLSSRAKNPFQPTVPAGSHFRVRDPLLYPTEAPLKSPRKQPILGFFGDSFFFFSSSVNSVLKTEEFEE